jgi:hypothetical protein
VKKLVDPLREKLKRINPSGLIVSGGSAAGDIEGPLEIIFAGLVGALAGFVIGLLAGSVARLITINSVKGMRGGMHWAAYGACLGALALAMMELLD